MPQQEDFVKREELNEALQENRDLKKRIEVYETVWGKINHLIEDVQKTRL